MTEPLAGAYLVCLICDRRRACFPHRRAQHPVFNGYNWLIKTCADSMAPLCCSINYESNGASQRHALPAWIANRQEAMTRLGPPRGEEG